MVFKPVDKRGYWLLHEGSLALSETEETGMCVDVTYCEKKLPELKNKLSELRKEIRNSNLGSHWVRRSGGGELNLDNNTQLANVLYKDMGFEPPHLTESGKTGAADEKALLNLEEQIPEISSLRKWRKLKKARDSLNLLYVESVNGIVHPFFNLHSVVSYRSSSDSPNFQNQPSRDEEQMWIVRRAGKPREGNFLAEFDFKSLEVNIGCPYHEDPNMISYVNGHGDMHQDMAEELLICDSNNLPREGRKLVGKSDFVFPEFYGRRWMNVAPVIWEHIQNMQMADGTHVLDHLNAKGIEELGEIRKLKKGGWWCSSNSFYSHIKEIERRMWNDVFPGYRDWRESFWNSYQRKGYFDLLTGFRCKGIMERNQVINYPIQGTAFHVLLFTLIKMNNRMKTENWKSKIIGQIHDSIVLDVYPEEWKALKQMAVDIVCEEIPSVWKWINVPLTLEAKRSAVNGHWAKMREVEMETK